MTGLALARTSKYFGFGDDTDHVVLDDGRVIGRIIRHPQGPPERPWFWTITAVEMKLSVDNRGYAATREEAMAAFRRAWERRSGAHKKTAPVKARSRVEDSGSPTAASLHPDHHGLFRIN